MIALTCKSYVRQCMLRYGQHHNVALLRHFSTNGFDRNHKDESDNELSKQKLFTPDILPPDIRGRYEQVKVLFPYLFPWRIREDVADQVLSCNQEVILFNMLKSLHNLDQEKLHFATKKFARQAANQLPRPVDTSKSLRTENTIFLWTRTSAMNTWSSHRLCNAAMFGEDVIIDCGFERELASKLHKFQRMLFIQIEKLYLFNKMQRKPAKIWLCNLDENSPLAEHLRSNPQNISGHTFIETTKKSYLELFDRDDLVYLSPDAKKEVTEIEPGKKYIIGGLPDGGGEFNKSTLVKASRDGILCQKFAPAKYLKYRGSSNMPIHKVFQILAYGRGNPDIAEVLRAAIPSNRVHNERFLERTVEESAESFKNYESQVNELRGAWNSTDTYIS